jgi:hypothetical protein
MAVYTISSERTTENSFAGERVSTAMFRLEEGGEVYDFPSAGSTRQMADIQNTFDFDWPSSQHSRASVRGDQTDAYPLPPSVAPSPTPSQTPGAFSQQFHPFGAQLTFMEKDNWDPDKTYDENPPTCIRYLIQWKVMKNGRALAKDEATDVVVSPECFWRRVLRVEREQVLKKKFPTKRGACPDEATVVVSVTERSKRPFTKKFKETEIDWTIVEKYLLAWTPYFEKGKELRVTVSYNFETGPQSTGRSAKRADKRGRTSATTRMFTEMDQLLEDEQQASGQPSQWPQVYKLMECSSPLCGGSRHCWINPDGKKHIKLTVIQLRELADFVKEGGVVHTHSDVPPYLRERWFAVDEQLQEERKARAAATASRNAPPIHITNMLPGHAQATPAPNAELGPMVSARSSSTAGTQRLGIPGLRDDQVREYTEWQKLQVRDPLHKEAFNKACEAALKVGYDLDCIFKKQDLDFFINEGVIPGIAWSFCEDIYAWSQLK